MGNIFIILAGLFLVSCGKIDVECFKNGEIVYKEVLETPALLTSEDSPKYDKCILKTVK